MGAGLGLRGWLLCPVCLFAFAANQFPFNKYGGATRPAGVNFMPRILLLQSHVCHLTLIEAQLGLRDGFYAQ